MTANAIEETATHALECQNEPARNSGKTLVPRADVYETPNEIVVIADMPGADESSVDITIEKNTLSITGNARFEAPEGKSPKYTEFPIGDYHRKFVLPNEIDREGISASMKHGVLKLVMPKSKAAQIKKINVTSA